MKIRRIAALCLAFGMTAGAASIGHADEYGNPYGSWIIIPYDPYNYNDTGEYLIPVITSPSIYETVIAADEVKIEWKYTGNEPCVVTVQDMSGNVSEIPAEVGNKARIMPNKLAKGGIYKITVKAGTEVSEPVTLSVASKEREIAEIVKRTPVEKAEERIDESIVVPEGAFDTKESADKHVKTVSVNVWKLNRNGQKVPSTASLTVNAALADTVVKIFDEIYANDLRFPISSLGGYSYRTTASGGRLSEHAYGTAIDINSNENYCVYSSGNVVGSFYKPYESPYSVVPEIINIFRKYNFEWGGSYGDYMHFSYFGT